MGRIDLKIDVRREREAAHSKLDIPPFNFKIDVQRERKASNWKWDEITAITPVESAQLPSSSHAASPSNQEIRFMDPRIYRAITTRDNQDFLLATQVMDAVSLMNQVTPQGNTVLHLAAISGCDHLVGVILKRCPNILLAENSMGNLAHHVAANAGHLFSLRILVGCSPSNLDLLEVANNDGDNPLHIAIKNGHEKVAMFLAMSYPKAACNPNKELKSPLYMAAEVGYHQIIKAVIEKHQGEIVTKDPALRSRIKSVVHAAIAGQNLEILDAILCKDSSLIHIKDEQGRTALSYAAFKGYLGAVDYLLDNYTLTVYQADQNGFFSIHTASAKGHITVIEKILAKCPDSIECLNSKGQNIIHVAAMRGKYDVISYLLKLPVLEKLINQRDVDGNTPLHLATMNWHPKVVNALTWDKRVSSALVNSEGFTALDVAEEYMGANLSFRKRLTWNVLQSSGAVRSQRSRSIQINTKNMIPSEPSQSAARMEKYKDRVNTLLLVSTLVATVTFAAGFTMPGGYNSSSDPTPGMATLHTKRMFHTFVICDTIAMYSSIICAVALIWAQLDDLHLILTALRLAMPFLGIALTSMSIAFMAGVYLVVSNLTWLANTVLIMGSIFLAIFLVLYIPLYLSSSTSRYPVIRHLVYYPYYVLLLATGSDTDDDTDE